VFCFGKVKQFYVNKVKISSLNINYPDTFTISLIHENNHIGSLTIELLSKIPIREIRIINEDINIHWTGTPDSLKIFEDRKEITNYDFKDKVFDHQLSYNKLIVENAYENEILSFFEHINNPTIKLIYTFHDDAYTLNLIDEIEN
jgi:hypothetical protein